MRSIWRYLPVMTLLSLCVPFANAQSTASVYLGLGAAHAKANSGTIDDLALPSLGGVFMSLGGDVMLTNRYGVGADISFRPAKGTYGPLDYRQTFYDFNGIYAPVNQKRFDLRLIGGLGGARTSFSVTQTSCIGSAVCNTQSGTVGSSSHFQVHGGVAVSIYVTGHIFIRPQFDLHYVPGFTDQFGSNVVPQGTVWVGYTFGSRD